MLLDRGPTFYRWSPRLAVVVTPRFSPGDVNAGANGIHPVQLRSAVGEGGGKGTKLGQYAEPVWWLSWLLRSRSLAGE